MTAIGSEPPSIAPNLSPDSRLVYRLNRPLTRPSVINQQMAQTIVDRTESLGNRLPLLDQQMQRWAKVVDLETTSPLIVYVQPATQQFEPDLESARLPVSQSLLPSAIQANSQPSKVPQVRAKWVMVQDAEAAKIEVTEIDHESLSRDRNSGETSSAMIVRATPVLQGSNPLPGLQSSQLFNDSLPLVARPLPELHQTATTQSNSLPIVRVNTKQLIDQSLPTEAALQINHEIKHEANYFPSSSENRSQQFSNEATSPSVHLQLPDTTTSAPTLANAAFRASQVLQQSSLSHAPSLPNSNSIPPSPLPTVSISASSGFIPQIQRKADPASSVAASAIADPSVPSKNLPEATSPSVHLQLPDTTTSAPTLANAAFRASQAPQQSSLSHAPSLPNFNSIPPSPLPTVSISASSGFIPQIQRKADPASSVAALAIADPLVPSKNLPTNPLTTSQTLLSPPIADASVPIADSPTNPLTWLFSASTQANPLTASQTLSSLPRSPDNPSQAWQPLEPSGMFPLHESSDLIPIDLQLVAPVVVSPVTVTPQTIAETPFVPLQYEVLPNEQSPIESAIANKSGDKSGNKSGKNAQKPSVQLESVRSASNTTSGTSRLNAPRSTVSGLAIPLQPRSRPRGFIPLPHRTSNASKKHSFSNPSSSALEQARQSESLEIVSSDTSSIASLSSPLSKAAPPRLNFSFAPDHGDPALEDAFALPLMPQTQSLIDDPLTLVHPQTHLTAAIVSASQAAKQVEPLAEKTVTEKLSEPLPRLLPVVQTQSETVSTSFEPLVLSTPLKSLPEVNQSQSYADRSLMSSSSPASTPVREPSASTQSFPESAHRAISAPIVHPVQMQPPQGAIDESRASPSIDIEALLNKVERRIMKRLVVESERRGQKKWH